MSEGADRHGARVVWTAFVVAVFGWGVAMVAIVCPPGSVLLRQPAVALSTARPLPRLALLRQRRFLTISRPLPSACSLRSGSSRM